MWTASEPCAGRLRRGIWRGQRKKAAALEEPEEAVFKPIGDAVAASLGHCQSEVLKFSTYRKYRNTLLKLQSFCEVK
jgi:hypothetical protein